MSSSQSCSPCALQGSTVRRVAVLSAAFLHPPKRDRLLGSQGRRGTDSLGDGLTVADALDAELVGSAMSGFGSSSEHAPTRHVASRVASAQRVRIMRSTPEKREP